MKKFIVDVLWLMGEIFVKNTIAEGSRTMAFDIFIKVNFFKSKMRLELFMKVFPITNYKI